MSQPTRKPAISSDAGLAGDTLQNTELRRLAAALNCSVQQLEELKHLSAGDIRRLRLLYMDVVYQRFSSICKRIAQATRFVPNAVSSRTAERIFGPQLTAQVAVHMPAKTIAAVGKRFSPAFLAQVIHYLDSRRAEAMLAELPTALTERIIDATVAEGDYAALAELAEGLPKERVLSLAEALKSPADLLRISHFISDKSRLTQLMTGIDPMIVSTALLAAFEDPELSDTALDLLGHMPVDVQEAAALAVLSEKPEAANNLAKQAASHPRRSTLAAFISACSPQ